MTERNVEVKLELFAVSEFARILPDGRLDILGAVPEHWTVPLTEPTAKIPVALVLSTSLEDVDASIPLTFRVSSRERGQLASIDMELHPVSRNPDVFVDGARVNRSVVVNLDIRFEAVGPHSIELVARPGGQVVAQAGFSVRFA